MENDNPGKKTLRAVENLIDEDRIINFSDAVFAFAATLLVLKIDLPSLGAAQLTGPRLTQELINLWPQYFANIISFLVIGYYWLTHHAIFALIKKYDQKIIWINIFFLIFLSFLPFPVDLFGDYNSSEVIVIFYCASLSLTGFFLAAIWFSAFRSHLTDQSLSRRHIAYYSLRFLLAPVVFALSIPLTLVDPVIAKASWVFVILGAVVINMLFKYKTPSVIEKESI